jgi:hypothetical protein
VEGRGWKVGEGGGRRFYRDGWFHGRMRVEAQILDEGRGLRIRFSKLRHLSGKKKRKMQFYKKLRKNSK